MAKDCLNYGRRMSRSAADLLMCGCPLCVEEQDDRDRFGKRMPADRRQCAQEPTPIEAYINRSIQADLLKEAVKDIH